MRDAGVEVVQETRGRARIVTLKARDEIVLEHLCDLRASRLVSRQRRAFELTPHFLGHLALQVSDLVGEAALPKASGEDLFDGPNQTWRAPSVITSTGSTRLRALRSLEKSRQLAVSSFVPGAKPSSTLCAPSQ